MAAAVDSTGERTIAITAAGREWEPMDLDAKLEGLLEFVVEERALGGEPYHQTRMRQLFLRLVRRVEPGVWYDLMYLPFVTRNQYLASTGRGRGRVVQRADGFRRGNDGRRGPPAHGVEPRQLGAQAASTCLGWSTSATTPEVTRSP